MQKTFRHIAFITVIFLSHSVARAENLEQRLIGKWQGVRDTASKCEFLAWNSNFMSNGSFEITFFANKERTKKINTEHGSWKASNGQSELTTDGVPTPEIYLYTFINNNTVKYVSTVKDPSADCQDDYEFTEYRVE